MIKKIYNFKNLYRLALIIMLIVITSITLSLLIDTDPDLYEGQPVVIIVGSSRVEGHIYNIRGDGRYNIRYINNKGEPVTSPFKRFEFEIVHDINNN